MKKFIEKIILWACPYLKNVTTFEIWHAEVMDLNAETFSMLIEYDSPPKRLVLPIITPGLVRTADMPKEVKFQTYYPIIIDHHRRVVIYISFDMLNRITNVTKQVANGV